MNCGYIVNFSQVIMKNEGVWECFLDISPVRYVCNLNSKHNINVKSVVLT